MSAPLRIQSVDGIAIENGKNLPQFQVGATVPTDGTAGYAPGDIFIKNVSNGIGSTLYVNEGSDTSCDFNAK